MSKVSALLQLLKRRDASLSFDEILAVEAKRWMERSGTSVEDVARAAGCSTSEIRDFLAGRIGLRDEWLPVALRMTGLSVEEVFEAVARWNPKASAAQDVSDISAAHWIRASKRWPASFAVWLNAASEVFSARVGPGYALIEGMKLSLAAARAAGLDVAEFERVTDKALEDLSAIAEELDD